METKAITRDGKLMDVLAQELTEARLLGVKQADITDLLWKQHASLQRVTERVLGMLQDPDRYDFGGGGKPSPKPVTEPECPSEKAMRLASTQPGFARSTRADTTKGMFVPGAGDVEFGVTGATRYTMNGNNVPEAYPCTVYAHRKRPGTGEDELELACDAIQLNDGKTAKGNLIKRNGMVLTRTDANTDRFWIRKSTSGRWTLTNTDGTLNMDVRFMVGGRDYQPASM